MNENPYIRRKRVLIVDDDTLVLFLIKDAFKYPSPLVPQQNVVEGGSVSFTAHSANPANRKEV